ncbi:universal stress protein [Actinocorallia lasiicapitis]
MVATRVLVGYEPDKRGEDALALAALIAGGRGVEVVVGVVRTAVSESPGPGRVDAEWENYLNAQAADNAAKAVALLADRGVTDPEVVIGSGRASGKGLVKLAAKAKCDLIVVGSAPGGPRTGISLGSTADQLLHSSPVPVLLAPKGYAGLELAAFDRVTVAYLRRPDTAHAVELASAFAARRKIPLRLLTIAIGHAARGKAAALADEQLRRAVGALEADLAEVAEETAHGTRLTKRQIVTEVVEGRDAATALAAADWTPGDLLVCGSSTAGPIRKVFMGDMSLKIIRAAPCPVIVVPRMHR